MNYAMLKFGDAVLETQATLRGGAPVAAEGTNRYVGDFLAVTQGGRRLVVSLGPEDRAYDAGDVAAIVISGAAVTESRAAAFVRLVGAIGRSYRALRSFGPEVIVCMDTGLPALAAWMAAVRGKAELVMCATTQVGGSGLRGWVRARVARTAIRSRRTVGVLACTPAVATRIVETCAPRSAVEVYQPRLGLLVDTAEDAPSLGERRSDVVFVGRLAEVKGVGELPRLARCVAESDAGRLVVIGDGPEREWLLSELRALIDEGAVEVVGEASHAEVLRRMASSRVVVVPSRSEGVAKVAAESLIAGTPVAAFRVGGIPDTVEDGINGLLVSAGDSEALCAATTRLLEDDALWEQLHRGALEFRRRASEPGLVFEDVLRNVLDRRRKV